MFTGMAEYEKTIAPVKRQLFSQLRPAPVSSSLDVVEIGMGTGPSLQYYSRDKQHVSITAVDPNDFMRPFLYKNLDSQGWERENVTWIAGIAENLPLKENSVDAVVCTLVLCSVADVEKAVQEAKRVLRPGGQFLFIEHTIAQPNASFLFKTSQWVLNPLQRALADGCNLTRDPLPVIERAGFQSVESMRFEVEGLGLISPHVAGIAVA
jgi:ubiquinone/menaquinone biosynthesis C-methylase UbiE